jgi:hypothetical protein
VSESEGKGMRGGVYGQGTQSAATRVTSVMHRLNPDSVEHCVTASSRGRHQHCCPAAARPSLSLLRRPALALTRRT